MEKGRIDNDDTIPEDEPVDVGQFGRSVESVLTNHQLDDDSLGQTAVLIAAQIRSCPLGQQPMCLQEVRRVATNAIGDEHAETLLRKISAAFKSKGGLNDITNMIGGIRKMGGFGSRE